MSSNSDMPKRVIVGLPGDLLSRQAQSRRGTENFYFTYRHTVSSNKPGTCSPVLYSIRRQAEGLSIAKDPTMSVRLKTEVSEKLETLARDMKRSKAYLASEAIEVYVDINRWQVAHIKEALEEEKCGAPGVPHEEVVEWIELCETDHELPMPKSKSS